MAIKPKLGLDSYRIYRTSAGREQILLAKIGQNRTRWGDETAPLEVESICRVASVNADQQQGPLSEPVVYTLIRKPAPVAPKDQGKLEHHPTFRWLGTDQLGGYSLRLFVHDEEDVLNSVSSDSTPQTPYQEIWRYETIDFERFSVDFNLDQATTGNLMEGKLYRGGSTSRREKMVVFPIYRLVTQHFGSILDRLPYTCQSNPQRFFQLL